MTPAQLDLARWLSGRTLASILDCLLLMLPAGLAQKAEPVLALTGEGRRVLSDDFTLPPAPHRGASSLRGRGERGADELWSGGFCGGDARWAVLCPVAGVEGGAACTAGLSAGARQAPERVLARLEGDLTGAAWSTR